jgi:hypothetical protein
MYGQRKQNFSDILEISMRKSEQTVQMGRSNRKSGYQTGILSLLISGSLIVSVSSSTLHPAGLEPATL